MHLKPLDKFLTEATEVRPAYTAGFTFAEAIKAGAASYSRLMRKHKQEEQLNEELANLDSGSYTAGPQSITTAAFNVPMVYSNLANKNLIAVNRDNITLISHNYKRLTAFMPMDALLMLCNWFNVYGNENDTGAVLKGALRVAKTMQELYPYSKRSLPCVYLGCVDPHDKGKRPYMGNAFKDLMALIGHCVGGPYFRCNSVELWVYSLTVRYAYAAYTNKRMYPWFERAEDLTYNNIPPALRHFVAPERGMAGLMLRGGNWAGRRAI